jgi:hypothetical protein
MLSMPLKADSFQDITQKAHKLFLKGEYTKSLQLYEKVFEKEQKMSFRMLLEMAFIYDGIGDYTKSLYVLSLYQYQKPNRNTLIQMESIAERYRLKGYQNTDSEIFYSFYKQYFFVISALLLLCCSLLFIYFWVKEWKQKKIPLVRKISFLLFIFLISLFLNLYEETEKAIIKEDNTFLMSAPSAASELLGVLNKGHKINIYNKIDVWYQGEWNGQKVYIKDCQLLTISKK